MLAIDRSLNAVYLLTDPRWNRGAWVGYFATLQADGLWKPGRATGRFPEDQYTFKDEPDKTPPPEPIHTITLYRKSPSDPGDPQEWQATVQPFERTELAGQPRCGAFTAYAPNPAHAIEKAAEGYAGKSSGFVCQPTSAAFGID